MGQRRTVLATGQTYHVFNRSVQKIPIFRRGMDFRLFTEAMAYYLQPQPQVKFSVYRLQRKQYQINLQKKLVEILAFCLMPTHFHFLLQQRMEKGTQRFIQKLSNSYAHYFSIKYRNAGPVFVGNFKSIHIETEEQLVHLSRYIHLNPVTAYLVERPEKYSYSSYKAYLGREKLEIINSDIVLSSFSSPKAYEDFVLNQKDYQRRLDFIQHLIVE
jgi:putative transposase